MTEIELLVALNLTGRLAGRAYEGLLQQFGSWDEVAKAGPEQLSERRVITPRVAALYVEARAAGSAVREIEEAERLGLKLIPLCSPEYPPGLKRIYDPPLVLYVKGALLKEDALAIALVGSRRCSYYGRARARELSAGLAARAVTVVSGLAHGIDGEAHRAALDAGGRTVGVIGTGFKEFYPPGHVELAEQIAANGAVISEFPLSAKAYPANFPRRNRVISGLSLGVVVIEGTAISGSLITAAWAAEQGKEIFAVPGPVDVPTSRGPHRLIRDGAKLVETADDILEEFPDIARELPKATPAPALKPEEKRVLQILGREEKHIDELCVELDIDSSSLMSILLVMEMKKVIERRPGFKFARR